MIFFWKLLKQKPTNLSRFSLFLGASHDVYGCLSLFISIVNSLMIFSVFYATVVIPTPWLNWLSLPLFLSFAAVMLLISGLFAWKVLIPHLIAYANYMNYKHGNLIRRDLEELSKRS